VQPAACGCGEDRTCGPGRVFTGTLHDALGHGALLGRRAHRRKQVGAEEAGHRHGRLDARALELRRQRLGERYHRGLGRVVGRHLRGGREAGGTRHVENQAGSSGAQVRHRSLATPDDAEQVYVGDPAPVRGWCGLDRACRRDPRIVHHHVESASLAHEVRDGRSDERLVRDVACIGVHRSARSAKRRFGFGKPRRGHVE